MEKTPSKVAQKNSNPFFFLTALSCPNSPNRRIHVPNLCLIDQLYSVYRTGTLSIPDVLQLYFKFQKLPIWLGLQHQRNLSWNFDFINNWKHNKLSAKLSEGPKMSMAFLQFKNWKLLDIFRLFQNKVRFITRIHFKVEGHLYPGLFNPKLQPQTLQPWTFQPHGSKIHYWKVWGWSLGLKRPGLKCPLTSALYTAQ